MKELNELIERYNSEIDRLQSKKREAISENSKAELDISINMNHMFCLSINSLKSAMKERIENAYRAGHSDCFNVEVYNDAPEYESAEDYYEKTYGK